MSEALDGTSRSLTGIHRSETDEPENEPPGHDTHTHNQQFIGEELNTNKQEGITRIYFQNLNGLKWDRDGGMWPMICQAMSGIHADIIGLAEINQDTTQYEVRHKLETIASKYFDHKKIIYGTSNRPARKIYKPGGTMMMTVMDHTSIITETTRDRMGRWVSTRYQGSTQQRITIITAYQVCQTQRTGNNTAANQQINTLLEESIALGLTTRINPRAAFTRDMITFVKHRQSDGDHILIVGDFNETIDESGSGTAEILAKCRLVDLCGHKLGDITIPNTYKRGPRRLDYALISPELLLVVSKVGYDPFDYRGITSDHRGLYIDLALENILGDKTRPLGSLQRRDFTADNPQSVTKYIKKKCEELHKHNFVARLENLEQLTQPDHDLAEKLDRDMIRAAQIAAKAAKQKYNTPWSPKLAKAWATIHLFKAIRSQLKNPHINNWATIQSWQSRYPGLPTELPRCTGPSKKQKQDCVKQ